MSIDFQAFTSTVVLDTFQKKIEVLEVWQGKVLAGLADGTLVLLEPDPSSQEAPWQVVQALKGLGRRALLQLQVWQEHSMLLSLDEEGVSLFKLPSCNLHCLANRTRYAQRFAWDSSRAMLAVAVKRKLLLFRYDGNEFMELKDLAIPDTVSGMAWIGESVCLGFKKEYALLNTNTGLVTELFKPGGPCITSIGPGHELLLAKGNVGIFLGQDGRISRKASLTWSDTPVAVAFSQPYTVALLPNYVEIRSVQRLSANGLAQVLPLKGMTVAAFSAMDDGSVVVASGTDSGIRRLLPIPFRQQAAVLAGAEEFQEALQLASYIPDSQAEERAEVNNELHTRYGHLLFAEGAFDEAMAHFGMSSNANPLVLLRLFPSLAPPSLLEPLQHTISGYKLPDMPEPVGDAYQKAVEVLLPYLMSHRSRLASITPQVSSGQTAADRQSLDVSVSERETTINVEIDVVAASRPKAGQAGLRDLGPEQRQLLSQAVDTAILKAMLATSDSGALLRFVQRPNSVDLAEGESALQGAGRYSELVALYQARGQHGAALHLLRQVSQKPEDLPVPPQGAAAELGGVTGVWAAVKYLVTVGASHLDLVKRHARWILKADPEAGLEMFIQMEDALPPSAALPILQAQAPGLCAPYLETALANGTAPAQEYHNELASIYLRTLLSRDRNGENAHEDFGSSAPGQSAHHAISVPTGIDAMERLKELVLTSEHVDVQHILLMLPSGQLPELRALLLERIGQHQEALRLYVHTMHNPGLAEAYCDRMYDAVAKQQGRSSGPALWSSYGEPSNYDMYLALIQVYLERRDSGRQQGDAPDSSNWEEIAHLLGRKHDRIEPLHALNLVLGEVPLKTVLPFLEGALRSAGEQWRNAAVVKSLRRSENLQVREESMRCKQRSVVVTFERACTICHKRIGGSAFVAYPGGTLAHYSCYKRSQLSAEIDKGPPEIQVYDISL